MNARACTALACAATCLLPRPLGPAPAFASVHAAISATSSTTGAAAIDPAACLVAYQEVERWLDAWRPPLSAPLPEDVVGVWMAIRWGGRLIGEGSSIRPFAALTTSPSSIREATSSALPVAFRQAMADAEANVRGPADEKAAIDAITPALTALEDAPLTLEMQFAHNVTRLRASTRETLLEQVDPGRHGMIVSKDGRFAAAFPGSMLAAEHAPSVALLGLLNQAEIGLTEFAEGLESGAVRVWAFEVITLAQAEPAAAPTFLTRGTLTVPEHAMNQAAIAAFGHELAWNLMNQQWKGDIPGVGVLGPYRAGLGRHSPLTAPPATQALVALALHRYGTATLAPASPAPAGPSNAQAAERASTIARQQQAARDAAIAIMRDLATLAPQEEDAATGIPGPIFFLIADREIPVTFGGDRALQGRYEDLRRRAQARLTELFTPETGFRAEMTPLERSAAAYALGTRAAVDAAWRSTDFSLYPALLPWIGWAELRAGGSGDETQRAALGLRVLRETVWDRQAVMDAGGAVQPDQVGGIAVGAAGASRSERPDWRTARPLAFVTTMVRESSLTTPDERLAEVARIVRSLRFLRQLSVREIDQYRLRDPQQAAGGIRSSLWTDTIDPEATATTLLAVLETLQSFDQLSGPATPIRESDRRERNRRSR